MKPRQSSTGHNTGTQAATAKVREQHISYLFAAEVQFLLASAVRLATNLKTQPLELPTVWTHGKHTVRYREIALRQDQADSAAVTLHQSATFLMAVAMKDAIVAAVRDPKNSPDVTVSSAYQIVRMIRNSFAHAPLAPVWSIDDDCKDRIFYVPRVIRLDTHNLTGQPFDWKHYGGPLALLRLCRFVRIKLLGDMVSRRKNLPKPAKVIHQVGSLILQQVDKIPDSARRIHPSPLSDGSIPIPGAEGYVLTTRTKNRYRTA